MGPDDTGRARRGSRRPCAAWGRQTDALWATRSCALSAHWGLSAPTPGCPRQSQSRARPWPTALPVDAYCVGYSATAGDRLIRPELMDEALRLGRILAELLPRDGSPQDRRTDGAAGVAHPRPDRTDGRTGATARPGPLALGLVAGGPRASGAKARVRDPRADRAVHTAGHHRGVPRTRPPAPTHRPGANRRALRRSGPAHTLARGRAKSRRGRLDGRGPREALESVDRLREEPALDGYHVLPSVHGELLENLGRVDEARGEFERAALLTANSRQRAAACASQR
jgi:RNA polymerase sigma-70 factor, ECF subfamily